MMARSDPESNPPSKRENGELRDPDRILDGLSKELNSALKAMAKAKGGRANRGQIFIFHKPPKFADVGIFP